jgi:uncharacterized RDD family membrane protein YckC
MSNVAPTSFGAGSAGPLPPAVDEGRLGSIAPPGADDHRDTFGTSPPSQPRRKQLGYQAGTAYLRRRLAALIIDNLVCLPMLGLCLLAVGSMSEGAGLIYLALIITYFFLLELRSGQTLGKRAAGLRVVHVEGEPVSAIAIAARNVLRLVDNIPGIPLVGALAMALTGPRRRRIGDLAGRTVVVEAAEHPFVAGPRSPLVTIYPTIWIGAAVALVLLIGRTDEA